MKKVVWRITVLAVAVVGMAGAITGVASAEYSFVTSWGGFGTPDGFFQYSVGIDSKDGYVYVSDWDNNRIQKFDTSGRHIKSWGKLGSDAGEFYHPQGLTVDSGGNVYVADGMNHRIQKFDADGNYLRKWGGQGPGEGQLERPMDIAVSGGYAYVADWGNNRIQKFSLNGSFMGMWGLYGEGDGDLKLPQGVATDSEGFVYVADTENHRIQKFDPSGGWVDKWGSFGYDDGRFKYPTGIDVEGENVFIAGWRNSRIQKFSRNNPFSFKDKWGIPGIGNGQFNEPEGVEAGSDGFVYVTDTLNHRVQKFEEVQSQLPAPQQNLPSQTPPTDQRPGATQPQASDTQQKKQVSKPSVKVKITSSGMFRLLIKAGGQAKIKKASVSLRRVLKRGRYISAQNRRVLARLLKKRSKRKAGYRIDSKGTVTIEAASKASGDNNLQMEVPRGYLGSRNICKRKQRLNVSVEYTSGSRFRFSPWLSKSKKLCY